MNSKILGEFGKEVLYLKKRMGFVKLALRNGTPLVPAYVFGANDIYRTSNFLQKTRLAIVNNLRYAHRLVICILYRRVSCSFLHSSFHQRRAAARDNTRWFFFLKCVRCACAGCRCPHFEAPTSLQ